MKKKISDTKIKVNDNVVVISGIDRGRRGKVLKIDRKSGRVIVEGVNKRNKFVKATQENPKGGAINIEFPVNLTNVMIFCDKCKKSVRVGIEQKNNTKVRVCKKCGKSI